MHALAEKHPTRDRAVMRLNPSSKMSHRRLVKMSGRMKSFYLGTSLAPRMEQAEFQIQDSRDLSVGSAFLWVRFTMYLFFHVHETVNVGASSDSCMHSDVIPTAARGHDDASSLQSSGSGIASTPSASGKRSSPLYTTRRCSGSIVSQA